ncbi:MAG: hypothetical protein MUF75_06660, partial [Bacteroidia bacterium]|nr:hypothetical protein [Bacteroidia bacterium]
KKNGRNALLEKSRERKQSLRLDFCFPRTSRLKQALLVCPYQSLPRLFGEKSRKKIFTSKKTKRLLELPQSNVLR